MDNQRQRADRLRSLHDPSSPLVLINVWDVASAKAVAATGVAAMATSSASMAWCLGGLDGSGTAVDGFFDMVGRISAAVEPLPLTVDIEAGFGSTPTQVAATVRKVAAAGAVGINLEDRRLPAGAGGPALYPIEDQQVRLRAAKAAAEALSVPIVINARVDTYLMDVGEPADRVELTVRRAHAYRAAGAECIFVPGVRDAATIATLAQRIDGPLNVLAVPGSPTVAELAEVGVARISLGSWPAQAALGLLQRIAQGVLTTGTYGSLEGSLSFPQAQVLIATPVTPPTPAGTPAPA